MLDLGDQPPADHFSLVSDPGPDPRHPLAMWWCADCGLAQLRDDTTVPDEPRAIEPRAAVRQAYEAVDALLDAMADDVERARVVLGVDALPGD